MDVNRSRLYFIDIIECLFFLTFVFLLVQIFSVGLSWFYFLVVDTKALHTATQFVLPCPRYVTCVYVLHVDLSN